ALSRSGSRGHMCATVWTTVSIFRFLVSGRKRDHGRNHRGREEHPHPSPKTGRRMGISKGRRHRREKSPLKPNRASTTASATAALAGDPGLNGAPGDLRRSTDVELSRKSHGGGSGLSALEQS